MSGEVAAGENSWPDDENEVPPSAGAPTPVRVEKGGTSAPGTSAKEIPGWNKWVGARPAPERVPPKGIIGALTNWVSGGKKATASVAPAAPAPGGVPVPMTPTLPKPKEHKSLLTPGANTGVSKFTLASPGENASEGGSRRRTFKKSRKARKTKSRKFRQRGGFTNSRVAFQPVLTRKHRGRPVGNIPVEVTEGNASINANYAERSPTMTSTDKRKSIMSAAPSAVSNIKPITVGVRRQSAPTIIRGSNLWNSTEEFTLKTPRQSLLALNQPGSRQAPVSPSVLESYNGPSTDLEAQMNPTQGGKRTKKAKKSRKAKKVTRTRKAKNQR